jgi:hypothetical protein
MHRKRKAEEEAEEVAARQSRPTKLAAVVERCSTAVKMDPHLLESTTTGELNAELARLEEQRAELKAALREIKYKMSEVRRVISARNAAQHLEDMHLQTTIHGALLVHPPPDNTKPTIFLFLIY